jgi:crotonobetainyl-CoA:carnitine CoA-transferase CaiB-like acyl-CoA transferase
MTEPTAGPLADLRVIDLATVIAGPGCARYLADFGADVIKVERPEGDTSRELGWRDPSGEASLWWRIVGRNKRTIALDLKDPDDLSTMLALCDTADVLVENFRPGTLERLGLGPDVLHARNPRLVVTRVTGFGQSGPYRDRPAFATQAEALSGFAAINGEPDGQPLLPPIALTDEVAGLVAAFATMVAVHSGVGQVVDVNLIESMLQLMGPLVPLYGLFGETQPRLGAGIPYTVPRNTYRCADGRWVAVSSSAESVAQRVLELIGLGGDERFAGFNARVAHREEIDRRLAEWMAERSSGEVLAAFERVQAAAAPVQDMADIFADPHVAARGAIATVDGIPMPDVVARLSATPGRLRWAGRGLDADGEEIRSELGRHHPGR